MPKLLNAFDPIFRHKCTNHRKSLQTVLILEIPRLTLDHFLIPLHNPKIVSIRFIQKMSPTSIPFLQSLLIDSFRMIKETIDIKTTFHKKEIS